jgi:hypothetical protein
MHSDERRLQQGGWNTMGDMKVYAQKALGHTKAIADPLHDPSICPLSKHGCYSTTTQSGTHRWFTMVGRCKEVAETVGNALFAESIY